jgi:serine/threonine protein kinase
MLVGYPPFMGNDYRQVYNKVQLGEFTFPKEAEISFNAQSLIRQILVEKPEKRLTLDQILQHDFLTSNQLPLNLPLTFLNTAPTPDYIRQYP